MCSECIKIKLSFVGIFLTWLYCISISHIAWCRPLLDTKVLKRCFWYIFRCFYYLSIQRVYVIIFTLLKEHFVSTYKDSYSSFSLLAVYDFDSVSFWRSGFWKAIRFQSINNIALSHSFYKQNCPTATKNHHEQANLHLAPIVQTGEEIKKFP